MTPSCKSPISHSTLLFCRGRQRNVQRVITHVQNHCSVHWAPAKRSQHINTTYHNIVGPAFENFSQTITTFQHNMLHAFGHVVTTCWVLKIELVRMSRCILAKRLQHHANLQMLHEKFDQFQIWADNTQHVATYRNTVAKRTQHVAPNNVAICFVEMLRSFGRGFQPFA